MTSDYCCECREIPPKPDVHCECSCHLPVVVQPERCAQSWRSIRCSKPVGHADAHEVEDDFLGATPTMPNVPQRSGLPS